MQEVFEYIKKNATVYIEEISRLKKSTTLLSIIQSIENTYIKFVSLKDNFNLITPVERSQMEIIDTIVTFERIMNLE